MSENLIAKVNDVFTEEALQSQDGKTCPLRFGVGGPIIGEVTMKYDPHTKALTGDMRVDDDNVAKFLAGPTPSIFERGS
jgi:hypothetical protein